MEFSADQEKLGINEHSFFGVAACHHPNGMEIRLGIRACSITSALK